MKYMTILILFFSVMVSTAHSELTPTDLEKIREIVKETVNESENELENTST